MPSFQSSSPAGFTLIELIAVLVVSAIALSSLVAVFHQGACLLQTQNALRLATLLADERMREIRAKCYRDPQTLAEYVVYDPGEAALRRTFDDVDDFNGWSPSPPVDLDGNVLDNYAGFTETVAVVNVLATNLNASTPQPNGSTSFKRITVTVSNAAVRVARISAVSEYD
ncbi:MAG: type II secretion system protein [Verrucomicrobiota bacterium]|nr:type II secretion system protein [Verrucomicrobiota bacterium]